VNQHDRRSFASDRDVEERTVDVDFTVKGRSPKTLVPKERIALFYR